ncbi:MAG: enoyl-CoA hydratase/isomerase family protein [Planctomycetota bacterium]
MNPKHFDYEERDGVGIVRLNRPDRLNALTFDSYAELRDTRWPSAAGFRVFGALTHRAFCSGGDVKDIIGHPSGCRTTLYRFTRMTCDLIENMRRLEKPIVGALNGTTCGAGAVMAACDVRGWRRRAP